MILYFWLDFVYFHCILSFCTYLFGSLYIIVRPFLANIDQKEGLNHEDFGNRVLTNQVASWQFPSKQKNRHIIGIKLTFCLIGPANRILMPLYYFVSDVWKPNTVPLLPWHIAEVAKQAKLANAFPKKLDNDGRTILKTEYREKNSTTL